MNGRAWGWRLGRWERVGTTRATSEGMRPRRDRPVVRYGLLATNYRGAVPARKAKAEKVLKQRRECNDVGRDTGEAGLRDKSTEMAAMYQDSSSRTVKPALDAVEMWTAGALTTTNDQQASRRK